VIRTEWKTIHIYVCVKRVNVKSLLSFIFSLNISIVMLANILLAIRKGKFRPTAVNEVPEGNNIYSPILSLTSLLEGVGGQPDPAVAFPPREKLGVLCIDRVCGSQDRSAIPRPSSV